MAMNELFPEKPPWWTRARATDPETSKAAASISEDELNLRHLSVLRCHKRYPKGMTDAELVASYRKYGYEPKQSESGLRTRRAELVDKGLIETTSERRRVLGHRPAIVWKAV